MSGPSAGAGWSASGDDDGWGSTAVHGRQPGRREPSGARDTLRQVGKSSRQSRGRRPAAPESHRAPDPRAEGANGWHDGGPASRPQQRANRATGREQRARAAGDYAPVREAIAKPHERGLPFWAALLLLLVIAIVGGLVDTIGSIDIQGGFNIGIVVASVVAILIVKRSHMFPIVVAPPIVYTLGAGFQYYLRSRGSNANSARLDAAANYLVYGFPAIATACAAVLIIAGIRMIIRK